MKGFKMGENQRVKIIEVQEKHLRLLYCPPQGLLSQQKESPPGGGI